MVDLLLLDACLRSATSTPRDRVQARGLKRLPSWRTYKGTTTSSESRSYTIPRNQQTHLKTNSQSKKAAINSEHLDYETCTAPKGNRRQTAPSNYHHLEWFALENKPQVLHPGFEETRVVMVAGILDGKLVHTPCCLRTPEPLGGNVEQQRLDQCPRSCLRTDHHTRTPPSPLPSRPSSRPRVAADGRQLAESPPSLSTAAF